MEAERIQVVGRDDEWLTVREAARYLKVSEATVFRWMKSGRLSYCKFGGSTRFKRSFLDRMAERVNGADGGADLPARCSVCGHTELVPGKLVSAGSVSAGLEYVFQPLTDARFWTLSPSAVPVRVLACTACGHVELFADAIRMDNLKRRSPG